MHTGAAVPAVTADVSLSNGLVEMSQKGLGMTAIVDGDRHVLGVFTDGDLRRALDSGVDVHITRMADVMHRDCIVIDASVLAAEAVHVMDENKINGLLVTDESDRLVGALNIHDLFRAGVM